METLSHAVGWVSYFINSAWALWFGIGVVVCGVLLAYEEWRLPRNRPKSHEVRVYANRLVIQHGGKAFRINGDAMIVARHAEEFDRYRFLKEVSGDLAARSAMKPRLDLGLVEARLSVWPQQMAPIKDGQP